MCNPLRTAAWLAVLLTFQWPAAHGRPAETARIGPPTASQADVAEPTRLDPAELNDYIEQAQQDWDVPGAAVAVVRDGVVVYQQGFGVRETGKAPRVDEHSLFEIGSLTKAFTATALALLVSEGRIGWDDAVIEHLPSFRLTDPWLTRRVTIRDIVAHRSGLEGNVSAVVPMSSVQVLQRARQLRAWVSFRDEALYSNAMYDIAGELIAAVSGMSWPQFVQRRLLDPLGMRSSSPSADLAGIWDTAHLAPSMYGQAPAGGAGIEDARGHNVTMPHWHTPQGVRALPWQIPLRGGAASGSMVSNVHDLSSWLRFNLSVGRDAAGRQLLPAAALQELHTPQIMIRDPSQFSFSRVWRVVDRVSPTTERVSYAMGWFCHVYRGNRYLYHGGALLGGMSLIALMPQRNLGVIVLANSYGRDGTGLFNEAVALRLMDASLGVARHDWRRDLLAVADRERSEANAAEAELQKRRRELQEPALPLPQYAGDYASAAFGTVRIEDSGGHLSMRRAGVFDWRLEHWNGNSFRLHVGTSGVDLMNFLLTFRTGSKGEIASFDPGWELLGGPFARACSAATDCDP